MPFFDRAQLAAIAAEQEQGSSDPTLGIDDFDDDQRNIELEERQANDWQAYESDEECGYSGRPATPSDYQCLVDSLQPHSETSFKSIFQADKHAEIVNKLSAGDETLLMIAARSHNLGAVELLLKHGANATLQDQQQRTALHHAMTGIDHFEDREKADDATLTICQLLIAAGATADNTVLSDACHSNRSTRVIGYLINELKLTIDLSVSKRNFLRHTTLDLTIMRCRANSDEYQSFSALIDIMLNDVKHHDLLQQWLAVDGRYHPLQAIAGLFGYADRGKAEQLKQRLDYTVDRLNKIAPDQLQACLQQPLPKYQQTLDDYVQETLSAVSESSLPGFGK